MYNNMKLINQKIMKNINFKKVGFAFLLMTVALMAFNMMPMGAMAQQLGVSQSDLPSALSGTSGDLKTLIQNIINTILGLLGFIAVIFVIYAGILYVTDGGGGENLDKAKNIIKNALIGIVIILASFAIVNFAFGITDGGGSSTGSSSVITQ
jgi:type IV secretory pathway VirB2 component (pilin)